VGSTTGGGGAGHNWKFLIDYKERNGRFILECMLKIRWGVKVDSTIRGTLLTISITN
jgi:hypothetical protein